MSDTAPSDLEMGRFRSQIRWSSAVLLLTAGLGAWLAGHGLVERSDLLGAFAPAALFGLVLAASWARLPARSLAIVALGGAVAALLVAGSTALALGRVGWPAPVSHAPLAVTVSALVAAAVFVSYFGGSARRRAVRLLLAAAVIALVYLVWPSAKSGPLAEVVQLVSALTRPTSLANRLGGSLLATLTLAPSLLLAVGIVQIRRAAFRSPSLATLVAFYGTPTLLLPLVSQSLRGRGGDEIGVLAVEVVSNAALLVLTACAAAFYARSPAAPQTKAWQPKVALALFFSLSALAPWALARQALPRWVLGHARPEADRVFAELGSWNDARGARELPASARPDTTLTDAELTRDARRVDPRLGEAIERLVEAAPREDLRQDAWERLVGGVNQASRRAGLPYYVDPTETVVQGARRWFRIDVFEISSVTRFRAEDRVVDVLGVHALVPARGLGQPLGLSHDGADEALVFTDSIAAYQRELAALLGRTPARCSRAASADSTTEAALLSCGRVLSEDDIQPRLAAALFAGVTRHELQHQIDRGDPPLAKTLAQRARARGLAVPPRINRELSAYLAELTAAEGVPRVSLARLFRLAVIDRTRIDGEAARVALQALSGHVADDAVTPAACYLELVTLDDGALRARALDAWQSEFGRALPPLRRE